MQMNLACFLVFMILAGSAGADTSISDSVDGYVNREIQRRHIPGLALAVVKNGRVEKLAGYGLGNVEASVNVTPKTVFQIQSVTKTFTSAAILLLAEEGKLSIEDPVGKYLTDAPAAWEGIKLRHLLSHTSGIKDFINEPTASLRLDISEDDVFKATVPRPLNFQPGEKYAYSNTNYLLLAMVIRHITGKPYGDFLGERIFKPLGMTATRIVSLSDIIPNRASGYSFERGTLHNGQFIAESILAYGGGGVVSTAEDMAKWTIALDNETVLKQSSFQSAWTGMKLNNGSISSYGLGWGVGELNGHRLVSHSGAHITGFTSTLVHYRDDALSVIVLTNSGEAEPGRIARHVARLYDSALMPAPQTATEDKNPQATELLRRTMTDLGEGRLAAESFTPAFWKHLSPQLDALRNETAAWGELRKIDALSGANPTGDQRQYHYPVTYAHDALIVTLGLAADGKIAMLKIDEE